MMSFKKICLIILCLFVQSSLAATQFGSVLVSKVLSVYDGDTFRVDIDSLSTTKLSVPWPELITPPLTLH